MGQDAGFGAQKQSLAARLLVRDEIITYESAVHDLVVGRTVLVTGAGGSIGGELARQVHSLRPGRLVLLDRDESLLQAMQLELEGNGLLESDNLVLACIRQRGLLREVFEAVQPDVVFHAAALKHLPMLERYPREAVLTNVLGTRNVLDAARASGAKTVVNVSTDKAADPTSVLGGSKRQAEMIAQAYAIGDTEISSVRFGNVLGSRGSFLPLLEDRIRAGAPVTITHPDARRFFMTIPEAAGLVINSATLEGGGDVFVLDMGDPVRILDLVDRYVELIGCDRPEIVFTGLRPGEKLEEVVYGDGESRTPTSHPSVWRTSQPPLPDDFPLHMAEFDRSDELSDDEVRDLLRSATPTYETAECESLPVSGDRDT